MDVAKFLKSAGVKMDTDQSPSAAAEAFIAAAKYRGLQPAEAAQLVDHDHADLSAINRWPMRPVISIFSRAARGFLMNDLSPTAQAHKHTNETGGYLAMDLENIEDPNGQDQIVELAVVNENGCVEAHLFFKPEGACLPQQVRPGLPSHLLQHCRTFSESKPLIQELVRRRDLVFYNAQRDLQLLGDSVNTAASFNCAMQRARLLVGNGLQNTTVING